MRWRTLVRGAIYPPRKRQTDPYSVAPGLSFTGMEDHVSDQISTLLDEQRVFRPAAGFKRAAHVKSKTVYRESESSRLRFWAKQARQLTWIKPWKKHMRLSDR